MSVDSLARAIAIKALNSSGEGAKDHDKLNNLDFASSGHTGFASLAALTALGLRVTTVEGKVGILKTDGDGTKALFDDGTYKTISGSAKIVSLTFSETATKDGFSYSLVLDDGTKFEGTLVFSNFMLESVYKGSAIGVVKNSDALGGQGKSFYIDANNMPYENVDISASTIYGAINLLVSLTKSQGAQILLKQDKLTAQNAGNNITITEVDGVVTINSIDSGTKDHNVLINRNLDNQHAINSITGLQAELNAKANDADLSTVAKSGNYSDLLGKPTIPTSTSQLTNDSGFINKTVNDLTNYYLKTETYTKVEVNNLISAVQGVSLKKVDTLPATGEANTIYLVPKVPPSSQNVLNEYIWIDNGWELIGSTSVDLTDYAKLSDIPTKLSQLTNDTNFITNSVNNLVSYYTKSEVDGFLNLKADADNVYNKADADNKFATKQYVDDKVGVSEVQPSAMIYLINISDFSLSQPTQNVTVPVSLVGTAATTKSFRYTYSQSGFISNLSNFQLNMYLSNMKTNINYTFAVNLKAHVTVGGVTDKTISSTSITTQFAYTNPFIQIQLPQNTLSSILNYQNGDYIDVEVIISKSAGTTETINITSTPTDPTNFVRNSGEVSSTNVIDYNGTDTQTQAIRNREYETGINSNKTYYKNGILLSQNNFAYDEAANYKYSYTITVNSSIGVTSANWKCDITPALFQEDIDYMNQHCKMSNTGTNTLIYYFDALPTTDIRISDVSFWKLVQAV